MATTPVPHNETVEAGLTPEQRTDLNERLHKALEDLNTLANRTTAPHAQTRLLGKVQGVALAIDYLRSYG